MATRIVWIDSLRAFARYLVFIAHRNGTTLAEPFIYAFNMPLFFWISGFLFNFSKYSDFKSFIRKRIKSLLVPYFIFSFMTFSFWLFVIRSLSIRKQALAINPWHPFIGIFYGIGVDPWRNPTDTALWFLPCLFLVELYYWLIVKFLSVTIRPFAVIGLLIAGYSISLYCPIRLPWSADVAMVAVSFYYIGHLLRPWTIMLGDLPWKWKASLMIALATVTIGGSWWNSKIDMNAAKYQNLGLFLIAGIAGTYLCFLTFKSVPYMRLVSYIGSNTIVLVGMAGICGFVINGLKYLAFGFRENLLSLPLAIGHAIIEVAAIIPAVYLINRFAPWIVGKTRANNGHFG